MKEILQMEMTRWILGRRLGLYNLTSRKNCAFGAKGKQANRASPVEMHRGRGQKVGPIDRGVRRSIYVFA